MFQDALDSEESKGVDWFRGNRTEPSLITECSRYGPMTGADELVNFAVSTISSSPESMPSRNAIEIPKPESRWNGKRERKGTDSWKSRLGKIPHMRGPGTSLGLGSKIEFHIQLYCTTDSHLELLPRVEMGEE